MIQTPERYLRMVELYREWNDRINVVSRKDIDNLYHHHILHSLSIAEYLRRFYPGDFPVHSVQSGPAEAASECQSVYERSVLDVGTGGGFPGIPLAMELPWLKFTLCDSIAKKIRVAQAVSDGLGLTNLSCVNSRAEALPGMYDYVVSRAVTSLENFYPWVRGKFGRSILYLKGGDVESEIEGLVRHCKVPRDNVRIWKISEWLSNDDYFAEKFVIEIGKNYLCAPK